MIPIGATSLGSKCENPSNRRSPILSDPGVHCGVDFKRSNQRDEAYQGVLCPALNVDIRLSEYRSMRPGVLKLDRYDKLRKT